MEQDRDYLPLLELDEARVAKTPFRLTEQARRSIRIKDMSSDTIRLVHNALLCDGSFSFSVCDDKDLQFLVSLLKEHKKLDDFTLHIDLNKGVEEQLAEAIQSSQIFGISISKTDTNIDRLLTALAHKNTLKKLIILFCPLSEEYQLITSVIQKNEHLEALAIFGEMPGEFMTALVPAISTHKSLKELHFNHFRGSPAFRAVIEIIRSNSSLQKLLLTDINPTYQLSEDEVTDLRSALVINKSLNLILFMRPSEALTTLLFESLAHNQNNLQTISIQVTHLSYDDIEVLTKSLQSNTRVTKLNFNYCELDEETIQRLCQGVLQNESLSELVISFNQLGMTGTNAICELLEHNRLRELSLYSCGIDAEECEMIAKMLEKNTSLVELSLMANDFGDEGLFSICEALTTNTTLRVLQVDYRAYGVIGLTGVKYMLTRNTTLRRLSITIDYKDEESMDLLCEGLKHNNSLTHLQCDCIANVDKVTSSRVQGKFAEALQDNFALDEVELKLYGHDNTFYSTNCARLLRRNRQLKSSIKFLVAILSHNIARSSHALTILPREIWKQILSSITSPGMEPFNDLVETIFKSYEKKDS